MGDSFCGVNLSDWLSRTVVQQFRMSFARQTEKAKVSVHNLRNRMHQSGILSPGTCRLISDQVDALHLAPSCIPVVGSNSRDASPEAKERSTPIKP